jgi:diketogulonate reductase-like aldo/keto reductase
MYSTAASTRRRVRGSLASASRRRADVHHDSAVGPPAQALLRWQLQHGRSAIPKSINPAHIAENFDVFDFELTTEEVSRLDGLDRGRRGGPDPGGPLPARVVNRTIPEP